MNCADCKHFKPARNPDTGRGLPSKPGKCGYEVEWPKLPDAYLVYGWGDRRTALYPRPDTVMPKKERYCATFEKIGGKRGIQADISEALQKP